MSLTTRIAKALRAAPIAPYQTEGVAFLEKHFGRAIIGDDCGLGKTWQAIAYLALHPEARPALIISPASVKLKWKRELRVFAGLPSTVLDGFKAHGAEMDMWEEKAHHGSRWLSVRWFASDKDRRQFLSDHAHRIVLRRTMERQRPQPRDIMIINYDVLRDWQDTLLKMGLRTIIPDEAQYLQNPHSIRTKVCRLLASQCQEIIPLSGTPISSRPVEFFPILNMVAPQEFPYFRPYAFRYCGPKRGWRGRGWDFSGASHLEELHRKVSRVMIRRMKIDVLPELPPKIRSVIPIDIDNRQEYELARDSFAEWLAVHKGYEAVRRARHAEAIVRLGELRRIVARGKLTQIMEWVDEFLKTTGRKIIIFAIHKSIIERLMEHYPNAAKIDGSVPPKLRQGIMDRFQNDPKCREFVGNIRAAGVGGDLYAASDVVFVEMAWIPGAHDQAEDRALRIGQKADKMTAHYFLGDNTVEEKHFELLETKRTVVGKVLNGDKDYQVQTEVIEGLIQQIVKESR